MIILLYGVLLAFLTIYSYALVDPNLTLVQHPLWVLFREKMIYLGYYRRDISSLIYISIVILLFLFHHYFNTHYKKISLFKLLFVSAAILLLSYPFLSHDFFNYIFDAKIVTFYHQNPYMHRALDYQADHWIRFMQWTHRTYPYGPTWLLLSLIPSFLSFGKFILNFIFFKGTFISFYIISVYYLNKMNKKWAVFFATNPLVIIEGLVSSHNDLVAVSIAIIGIYYLMYEKKTFRSRLILLFSGGIKYITLPLVALISNKNKNYNQYNTVVFLSIIALVAYLTFASEIQPWYFLAIFAFLPFYETFVARLNIFFAGLLLSYYPYIRLGGWDSPEKIAVKHYIIGFFFIINVLYLLFIHNQTISSV